MPPNNKALKKQSTKSGGLTEEGKAKLHGRMQGVKSAFMEEVSSIHDLLEKDSKDSAISKFQKAILMMLIETIPLAEDKYRETLAERSAYAMNTLISQAREVIAEIRADQDRKQLGYELSEYIIFPAFNAIAYNVRSNIYNLQQDLEPYIKDDAEGKSRQCLYKALAEVRDNIIHHMNESGNSIQDRILETIDR